MFKIAKVFGLSLILVLQGLPLYEPIEVYAGEQTYTADQSGTFNTPAGTTTLVVELWGGGGGGGAGPGNTNGAGGGGGGGGAYVRKTITSPGSSYSYSVGGSGGGGAIGNGGSTGGNTSFDGSTYVANGGNGGGVGALGAGGSGGSGSGGDVNRNGGNGATAISGQSGGGGGGAGTNNPGSDGGTPNVYTAGGGGSELGSNGGDGCNTTANCAGGNASTGGVYGGGGGGGMRNAAGGNGTGGFIRLTYYGIPTLTTQAVDNIGADTVTANGTIITTGDATISRRGFAYMEGSSGDPTVLNEVIYEDGTFTTGAYELEITELSPNTDYRIRAYAVNSEGTGYGSTVGFTTDVLGTLMLSGTIYQADGSTVYNCNSNNLSLELRVNGEGNYSTTCDQNTGAWSVPNVSAESGESVVVYISGGSVRGSTVLVTDNTEQINVPIIQNRVVLRDEVNGTITNSEIAAGDTGDADDLISVSGGNLTVGSTDAIHIYTGDTFSAGGNVTGGRLLVIGNYSGSSETLTLTGSGTSTSRPLYINGGTFTAPSTTTFSGPVDSDIEATTYNELNLSPTITGTTTYTFLGGVSINGNFVVDPTAASSQELTVNLGGTTTVGSGYATTLSGTTSGTSVLKTRPVSTDYDFSTGLLNIGAAGTLDAGGSASTIALTGTSGVLFTRAGTFTAGNSTVVYSPDASLTLTSGTFTSVNAFYNLSLTPSISTTGRTYTFGSGALATTGDVLIQPSGSQLLTVNLGAALTIESSKTLTVGRSESATSSLSTTGSNFDVNGGNINIATGGTLSANGSIITVNGDWTNNGTFTPGSSEVIFASAVTATLTGDTSFSALTTVIPGKTLQFTAGDTFTVGGLWTVTGDLDPDYVYLTSTTTSPWFINFQGTSAITYAHISYGGCDVGSNEIDVSDETSFDGGNNGACWLFDEEVEPTPTPEPTSTPTPSLTPTPNLTQGVMRFDGGVRLDGVRIQ